MSSCLLRSFRLSPFAFRFLVVVGLLLAAGCAKPPGIGVTQIKARTQAELQRYLLDARPDVDHFRLRGPFAVAVENNRRISLSATETVIADRYLASPTEKGPLIIFLHGYDSWKEDHAYQAMHAASWGLHSLSIQLPNTGPWTGNARTLMRLVSAIQRAPEIVDPRIDAGRIVLVGHSFGGAAVAMALGDGAAAAGAVLLDAAGIGKDLPRFLKQINRPVMLLGADEQVSATRNRDYFYRFIPRGVAEVSIKDADHLDAQFPAEDVGDPDEARVTFVSALTSAAFSLATTGKLDYAWSSFSDGLRKGTFLHPRRK